MRRTILSVMALACTAVLASTVPAFADGTTPSPTPTVIVPTPTATSAPAPTATPTPVKGYVSVVPKGAPDTGVAPVAQRSGADGGLIGGGAAAVLVAGGAAVFLVRRKGSAQA